MTFQAPITITDAIRRIRERRLLLPAIQRDFVWPHTKVEWLFDSLLQDYPIGSFLFWEVRDRDKVEYKYYEVLRQYKQDYYTENPEFATKGHGDFEAVLDGQQRLTALYIGLAGTYAYYRGRVWRADNEYAYPTRRLYLNILAQAPEDDDQPGRIYEFKFLTDEEYAASPEKWFLVGKILDLRENYEFNKMLNAEGYNKSEFATKALSKLHGAIHTQYLINYYRIENADMERALNVFVRVNSAEPLTLSDMLMSTAIAHWKVKQARQVIPNLVGDIRERGFFLEKDFILKACLYLYSSDIRYRVSNFTASVKPFEDNWDAIRTSILTVFDLARDFAYNDRSLTSKNTLLPVIYWVHHKGLAERITSGVGLRAERQAIQRWLHTMLLKGIIGAGSADTVLAAIRRAFAHDEFGKPYVKPELVQFPADEISKILRAQGRDPEINDDFIDGLLYTRKDARQSFTILALLAPHLDYKNSNFHVDHLHPSASFRRRRLTAAGIQDAEVEFYKEEDNWNSILNLSYLDANENQSKQDKPLADWVAYEAKKQKVSPKKFCDDHLLPDPEYLPFARFRDFVRERQRVVGERLRLLLQA